MFWAILIIIVSVLLGTVLALFPRGREAWLGPLRTFGLMAALAVVIVHLLPEALARVGAWAILAFLGGLVLPEMLGKFGVFLFRAGKKEPGDSDPDQRRDFGLEAGYFGLLLHRVGDGIGLGAFAGELISSPGRGGVITALAAHAVPVVAIVVLTFDSVRGRGSALWRAAGLALASIVGVFIARGVPTEVFTEANAWISAFVGGTLIHVVTHDLGLQLPKTFGQRAIDIAAAISGVYTSFVGREAHVHYGTTDSHGHFEHALVDFAIETGPLLILGLFIGALLTTFGARIPARFFRSRGMAWDAARGTIVGAPLPLCSCSVLPISAALKSRGAAPALVVAFLLATPELGVETFALSVRFLGWEMAWVRLAGALGVAFVAAVAVGLAMRKPTSQTQPSDDVLPPPQEGPWPARVLVAFDELFQHVGAWMILGIVAAALLEVGLPAEAFKGVEGSLVQFSVITLVAVPSYVCAPSATPLAAVLLAKGMSPGAVMVGLLLGPATNVATLIFLRRWFGIKAAAVGISAVVVLSWALGFAMNAFGDFSIPVRVAEHHHDYGIVWMWCAVISGLLLVRATYRGGVRGFLSSLSGDHGHDHGHGGERAPWEGGHGGGNPMHAHAHAHGHGDARAHGHDHSPGEGNHDHDGPGGISGGGRHVH